MSLPEGQFATVHNGWRIHYHAVGEGHPVLFLHGSGPGASGWSNFRQNAGVWAEHGYRCILADSLGYGHSSKPTDVTYDLQTMSGCMVALMDQLGHERFSVVGNSQGGAQAIRIALDHPDRVSKLVLMAPGGLEEREVYMELKGIRSMLRCIYGAEGITLFGLKKVFEKQLFDPSLIDDDVVKNRFAIAQTQPIEVFKNLRVDNQSERLKELQMPVLGLWGMNDVFCPPSGATTLASEIRDCRVVLFSQCGHWVMVEHREAFNRLCLDFLAHADPGSLAEELYQALRTRVPVRPLTERFPSLDIDDAYRISRALLSRRLGDGEVLIGKKIGVTSPAVQDALGVHQPDFGYLTDAMLCEGEVPVSDRLIQPRAEGEIAFRLDADLIGPGVTPEAVLRATASVHPCFEVVDSRIQNWTIRIQDTIADNASSGLFAVGPGVDPDGIDFVNCEMRVYKNGAFLSSGKGSAALGSPLHCVAWLANTLGAYGIGLKAGDIILSGSLVPLEPVQPGDHMRLSIQGIGETTVRFT